MDIIDTPQPKIDLQYAAIRYKQYTDGINDLLKNHKKPHNRKYKQGFFIPKHPLKWMNLMEMPEPTSIVFRSGWEKEFYDWMDKTTAIYRCGVEVLRILYKDPIRNKMAFYVPDAYFEYIDNNKQVRKVLVEIKPLKEASLSEASNGYDKLMIAKNSMKWKAAIEFCKKRGIEFKIMHEHNLGIA